MTKSQNTKNEQQEDLCITSEQLTEQWKKGELPNGYYWIRLSWGGMVIMAYHTAFDGLFELDDHYYDSDEISEVLAPVPSYEEWQASEKYNKHLEEVIKTYERKEKQHTDDAIAYNELAKENEELKEILERHKKATAKAQIRSCDFEIINAQLKELLKECKEVIKNVDTYYGNYDSTNGYLVITKIDEALQ